MTNSLGRPLRVLIVDDDVVDRAAVRRALRPIEEGADITEAETAAEAAELLQTQELDCVLLDLRLPDQDGSELLLRVRAGGMRIPVVMLTGHGDEETAVQLLKAGASDYIPKATLTPERLVSSLRAALRLHHVERRAERHGEQLKELATAAVAVNASLSLSGILAETATRARRILDASRVALVLFSDEVSGSADIAVEPPLAGSPDPQILARLHSSDAATATPWLTGAVRFSRASAASLPWLSGAFAVLADESEGHVLAAPLRDERARVFGALLAFDSGADHEPNLEQESIAVQLAQIAAGAVRNARLYGEAQQASRAREELVAIVSHDLRNPLNAISTTAQHLERINTDPAREREREYLARVLRAVAVMERLLEDLLDVTRVGAGHMRIAPSLQPPARLLMDVLESFSTLASDKRVSLEIGGAADLPDSWFDGSRLHQVLSNLVGNALKFTPEGGRIFIDAAVHDGELVFRVQDTGPGIPPQELQRVFEPFFQGCGTSRQGAGLGLAIARGIVEAHGGRIWVESRPEQGALFSFSLPLGSSTQAAERAAG